METRPAPFDLDAAVARWRARVAEEGPLTADALDELEAHLCDAVEARVAEGMAAREAFEAAVWQMGHAHLIAHAFREDRADAARPAPFLRPPAYWRLVMLKNYVKIALRSLRRHPGYTAINVLGLGLGIAASLLIFLYARHELTYDRFHEKSDRIYQVYKERLTPTGMQITRDTWMPMAARLQETYPAVENAVRRWAGMQWVHHGEKRFEERVTYTDAALWEVFDFPLAQGDPATVFADPFSVVLSQETARKYFGEADPMGQVLTIDHDQDYTVTGVLAPIPTNSTIAIDLAVPFRSLAQYEQMMGNWDGSFLDTFVLLREGADAAALEAQFPDLITRLWNAEEAGRTNFKLEAMPDLWNAMTENRAYAYILIGIALVILLIAAINFTNLSTARSLERAREVGLRKVLGAQRAQLVGQFLGESMVMSFAAVGVGLLAAYAARPFLEDLYAIELPVPAALLPAALLLLVGAGLFTGLLAGGYPALFLSGFKPITSLQGGLKGGRGGRVLRHGLVVTQFTLAAALIMATLLVRAQVGFMQHASLNFDQAHVVALTVDRGDFADAEAATSRLEAFKQELARLPGVAGVASSSHVPADWGGWFTFAWPGGGADEDRLRMRQAFMDDRYFETYGMRLREGRGFDRERAADAEDAVILNVAALKAFGWASGEGKQVRRGDQHYDVIGVVEDYHFESLQNEIAPVLHFFRPPDHGVHGYISVRLRPADVPATLAAMEAAWKAVDASRPLPYVFVDDAFAQLYEAEGRLVTVAGVFTLLAILIACLGLFGLASWMVTQRVKEVGIRKVMGASATRIALLLSKDFARLVLVAVVLAAPLAYLGVEAWLGDFAYRIDLASHLPTFAAAGLAALAIAVATVSVQALRAAHTNPVETLRYE